MFDTNNRTNISVLETTRKPPVVEAQNAVEKQKNTAKNDFQYGGCSPP